MELEVLPECRWRGRRNPVGRYVCDSPKIVAPAGVTAKHCNACHCQNHDPGPGMPPRAARHASGELKTTAKKPCANIGIPTGETVECPSCCGKIKLKLLECSVYGKCTIEKKAEGIACCKGCNDYKTPSQDTLLIKFHHGLGDMANFASMIALYTRRGYKVDIHCYPDEEGLYHESHKVHDLVLLSFMQPEEL